MGHMTHLTPQRMLYSSVFNTSNPSVLVQRRTHLLIDIPLDQGCKAFKSSLHTLISLATRFIEMYAKIFSQLPKKKRDKLSNTYKKNMKGMKQWMSLTENLLSSLNGNFPIICQITFIAHQNFADISRTHL